jgi:hypothetical protein
VWRVRAVLHSQPSLCRDLFFVSNPRRPAQTAVNLFILFFVGIFFGVAIGWALAKLPDRYL